MKTLHRPSMEVERSLRTQRLLSISTQYTDGVPVEDIAASEGCSRGTVLRIARAMGLAKRDRKKFPQETVDGVKSDLKAKMPLADIAAKWRVSQAWISQMSVRWELNRYRRKSK